MQILLFFLAFLKRSTINLFLALAILSLAYSSGFSQVNSYPYSESFESGFGDWTQATNDEFDWTRTDQSTPSSNTGPNSASDGSYFLYIEATNQFDNGDDNEDAYLECQFDLTGSYISAEFSFDYHMYGADVGRLRVRVNDGNGYTSLFNESGNIGDFWNTEIIDLSAYIGEVITIRFDARIEEDDHWSSDISFDNLSLDVVLEGDSFENSQDGWANVGGDFDWERDENGTPSNSTGPSSASDGSYYMYTEVSNPVGNSENGYLVKEFDLTAAFFTDFEFDYHMYGSMINEFSFEVSTNGGSSYTSLFTETGDQGDVWNSQSIDLSAYSGQIIFLRFAVETPASGSVWQGDVAVDNVRYTIVDVDDTDSDADGVVDYFDLDDDNDGVPDSEECPSDEVFNISGGDGGSTTNFTFDNASDFYIDFDYIDNSVSILVNGLGLHPNSVLQMEDVGSVSGQIRLVFDSDGAYLTTPWVANSNGLPRVRVEVDAFGTVTVYGTRTSSSSALTLMRTLNSSSFNNVSFVAGANSFSIVNPDDLGPDGISGTAYVTANCDVDLDGIPNRLDLNSDGDGCSDAFESGATTDETTDFQFSDVNGDANGLSPSVDPSSNGTINYMVNGDFKDASTVSCSCPFSEGGDNDSDNYDDFCDHDDDNDGISDVSEYGSCGDGQLLDWNNFYSSGNDFDEGGKPGVDAPSSTLLFDGTTTITISNSENITAQGGDVEYRVNDYLNEDSYTIYQEAFINSRSTHLFEFSEPVYNLSFTIFDLDAIDGEGHFLDYIKLKLISSDGSVYNLQSTEYTTSSSNEYIGQNTFRGVGNTDGNVQISNVEGWIVSMEVIYYNGKPADEYNLSTGSSHFTAIGDIGFCTAADSDGDGIIDAKEVDSDADGCPDAIEVGFTYEDIYLSGPNEWELDTIIDNTGSPLGGGMASNSDVITTSSQGVNCGNFFALAVELSEFIAVRDGNESLLEWTTLTERENDYFEVYWRTDAQDWIKIGQVQGAGYSESELNYSYIHPQPEIGNNYYKISAVDFNGVAEESEIRTVVFSRNINGILIYPNPNKDQFVIANVDIDALGRVEIYNVQGQRVLANIEILQSELFVRHNLSSGVYFIHLHMNDGSLEQLKFIVKDYE